MTKKFCDICGKEIKKINETWSITLQSAEENKRVSFDERIEEICESCATIIHCCTSLMKTGRIPDFDNTKPMSTITEEQT